VPRFVADHELGFAVDYNDNLIVVGLRVEFAVVA
jgi:hypothetical protein